MNRDRLLRNKNMKPGVKRHTSSSCSMVERRGSVRERGMLSPLNFGPIASLCPHPICINSHTRRAFPSLSVSISGDFAVEFDNTGTAFGGQLNNLGHSTSYLHRFVVRGARPSQTYRERRLKVAVESPYMGAFTIDYHTFQRDQRDRVW